ncbi:unnamed protein product [Tuber aestivum]|uniref:Uncharacterized protein n=1 Tax=Tuber aestivum TaxID=59557 RepID=A0A292PVX4_9PEZI|nr:unnamed protein product [Tuber aestivum]
MPANRRHPASPAVSKGKDKMPRGRTRTKQQLAPPERAQKLNTTRRNSDAIAISTHESDNNSDEEPKPPKRRRRNESLQACRYRKSATRARLPPHKLPPLHARRHAINKKVDRLTRQLQDADRRDRSAKDVSKWCTERSDASAAVTKFIARYYLDMNLITSPARLKFAEACVNCLKPYCGNRPTFDVCDAMWRMLRALELDLETAKGCGIDTLFKDWHNKNIYCQHVRKIAMQVEKRLMDMRCVIIGEGGN